MPIRNAGIKELLDFGVPKFEAFGDEAISISILKQSSAKVDNNGTIEFSFIVAVESVE